MQRKRKRGEAISQLDLGRAAIEQKRFADAKQHTRQALEIFIDLYDYHSQAAAYHQLGMISQQQRNWQQSERYLKEALNILESIGDEHNQAKVLCQIAKGAEEQGKWPEALPCLLKSLRFFRTANDEEGLGLAMQAMARAKQADVDPTLSEAIAGALGMPAWLYKMIDPVLDELTKPSGQRAGVKFRIDLKL